MRPRSQRLKRTDTAEAQLEKFLARYTPEIAGLAKAALQKMRKRLPGAVEMVYDNYNALVIGFCPGERPSDVAFSSIAAKTKPRQKDNQSVRRA